MSQKVYNISKKSDSCKYITFVSRRAAGVWTHLPSLTYSLFSKNMNSRPIVWIDFGIRYEMFNHLRINPERFPECSSLLGLINHKKYRFSFDRNSLITYEKAIYGGCLSGNISVLPLCNIHGHNIDRYRYIISEYSSNGHEVYLIPIQTPLSLIHQKVNEDNLSVLDIEEILILISEKLQPAYIFLTFEGQPEDSIFQKKIVEDNILKWVLSNSDMIISFVRFDSEERFKDSITIPSYLSRNKLWRERLRIVINRVIDRPNIQNNLKKYILGCLSVSPFIGESVNSGRIPIVDIWCRQGIGAFLEDEKNYINSLELLFSNLSNE